MTANISTPQVVIMGLVTVFVVLICLIVIIKILGAVLEKVTPAKAPAAAPAAAPKPAPAPVPAADKQKTVAAIAVAIAEYMGTDVSHIRIHSIKRI